MAWSPRWSGVIEPGDLGLGRFPDDFIDRLESTIHDPEIAFVARGEERPGYRISSMPRRVLRRTLAKGRWAAHTIEDYELWIEDGRLHWENRAPRNRRLFLVVHTLTTVFVTAMGSLMGGLPVAFVFALVFGAFLGIFFLGRDTKEEVGRSMLRVVREILKEGELAEMPRVRVASTQAVPNDDDDDDVHPERLER